MERQRATREFISEFKRKREEWKAMERERMEEENRRIKEYAATQEQRQEVAKAEKRAREQALDKVQRALADQIRRDREDREEQELVRQELYLEEQEQAVRRRERDEMEVRIRQRLELQRERDEQLQFKRVRDVEIKEEEDRFRQQVRHILWLSARVTLGRLADEQVCRGRSHRADECPEASYEASGTQTSGGYAARRPTT